MRKAVIAILMSLVACLAACTSGGNNTSTPPSTSHTPVPTSAAPAAVSGDRQAGLAYMRSSERIAAYDSMWGAAAKVAQAIQRGELGPFEARTSSKTDRVSSTYTGWGSLQVAGRKAYAYVYWRAGAVDYTQGVLGFSFDGVHLDKGTEEMPYLMSHDFGDYSQVMGPEYFGGKSPQGQHRYPASVEEAQAFDRQARSYLEASLKKAGL